MRVYFFFSGASARCVIIPTQPYLGILVDAQSSNPEYPYPGEYSQIIN